MVDNKDGRLKVSTKMAFGVGQAAEGIKNVAFSMFVVLYYNQVLGLDPGLAGLAAGIALAFDAVTDPLAGALSDNFRSRWGRRHPFMVISSVPLAITFFFLFVPPPGLEGAALFSWLLVMAILVRGSMTFYHVPHLALGAELSSSYLERTKVFTYATLFGYLGGIGMRTLALPVFFPSDQGGLRNPDAYAPFAVTMGFAMLVAILLCAWGTRRHIPHLPQATGKQAFSFADMFGALWGLLRYPSFRSLFFGMSLTVFMIAIEIFMYTYMGLYFWGLTEEQLGLLGAAMLAGLPASFFLVPWMTRKLDKRNALITSTVVMVVCTNVPILCRFAGVFPENGAPGLIPILFVFRAIYSVFSTALWIVPASMFADIGDEVALSTGKRIEGLIFASRSLIGKGVYGLGTAVGGFALSAIAFPDKAVPGQVDPGIVFNLGLLEGPITSVFVLIGVTFYMRYPLSAQRHAEIRAALDQRARTETEPEPPVELSPSAAKVPAADSA